MSLHPWNVSPQEAVTIQKTLRTRISYTYPHDPPTITTIAGVDVSSTRGSSLLTAGVVVLDAKTLTVLENVWVQKEISFPYIPGFLSFREIPVLLEAITKLTIKPDVFMVDGQGIAHPRRMGIATHLGVLIDQPTIGVAKKKLTGRVETLSLEAGSTARMLDKKEVIGMAVRTKKNVKPVYVSLGHKMDLALAVQVVLNITRGYRLPEPTRLAHNYVNDMRRRYTKRPLHT